MSQFTDKCQGFCQKLFTYTYGVDSRLSVPHSAGETADKFGDLQRENFIPKKSRAKNNTNLGSLLWFVLFLYGAVEGTRTLTVSHRNLNPARMPISPRLQAQLLYHKAGICKAFAASAQKNQKQCKNGCFFSDYLLYCYSLAGVTQW